MNAFIFNFQMLKAVFFVCLCIFLFKGLFGSMWVKILIDKITLCHAPCFFFSPPFFFPNFPYFKKMIISWGHCVYLKIFLKKKTKLASYRFCSMSTDYEDTPETEDAIRMHGYPGGHEIFPTTERYDAKAAEVLGERPSSVVTLISCTDIKVFFFFFFCPSRLQRF